MDTKQVISWLIAEYFNTEDIGYKYKVEQQLIELGVNINLL